MTDPNNYINVLEVFRLGVTYEIISLDNISEWAENIINDDTIPNDFIIDVYFASHMDKERTITLIDNFIYNKKNSALPTRVFLGLMYRSYADKKIELKKVVSSIYGLYSQRGLTNFEERQICSLDDQYDLAINHIYGEVHDVEKEVLEFLSVYKEFTFNNFKEWDNLNKSVEIRLAKLEDTEQRDMMN